MLLGVQTRRYAALPNLDATARSRRLKEYALYRTIFTLVALASVIGGLATAFLVGSPQMVDGRMANLGLIIDCTGAAWRCHW